LGPAGLDQKRADQRVDFMWSLVRDELEQRLATNEAVAQVKSSVRDAVMSGTMPAANAADQILEAYEDASRLPGNHFEAGYSPQAGRKLATGTERYPVPAGTPAARRSLRLPHTRHSIDY